jgi:PPOX class probable F420-dependent enzyme
MSPAARGGQDVHDHQHQEARVSAPSTGGRADGPGLPDAVRALAEGPNLAHVATVLPDGAPHVVPVWIGVEDGRLAFLTGPGSRKARNLARDPRIALSIVARDDPFTMAHVRGRVGGRLEGEPAWTFIDRLAHEHLGGPYPRGEERVVFLVEPERAWARAFA